MTPEDYSALVSNLGDLTTRLCQDAFLFDYYEGKSDGNAATNPKCALPELPAIPVVPTPK